MKSTNGKSSATRKELDEAFGYHSAKVIFLDDIVMPSDELKSEQMDKALKKYKKTLKKRMKKLKKGE